LIQDNSLDEFKDAIFRYCKEKSIGMGAVMQTLRMAAVGSLSGPDIVEVVKVIGKNSILERLELLRKQL
jgi:glutamyl/glutaminyl-tRNA synthetase